MQVVFLTRNKIKRRMGHGEFYITTIGNAKHKNKIKRNVINAFFIVFTFSLELLRKEVDNSKRKSLNGE